MLVRMKKNKKYITSGNVKWFNYLEKVDWQFLLKHAITIQPRN